MATIESSESCTPIEGGQLSDEAVHALIAKIEVKSFATRDEQAVAGCAEVMELLFSSWEHIPFNENHITQIQRKLLAYSSKDERHRGQYKSHENRVTTFDEQGHEIATIFQTASPVDTPALMRELVDSVASAHLAWPLARVLLAAMALALTEGLQFFAIDRHPRWLDVGINLAGAGLGMAWANALWARLGDRP